MLKKINLRPLKDAALAFDIPQTTHQQQIRGVASRIKESTNCQKLSKTEEST